MINMIVAYDQNRGIGKNGELLWQSGEMREDMKRFRTLTRGATIIMGRKTLESIGMALPKRRNIVVSHQEHMEIAGVDLAASVDEALAMSDDEETFVIGGQQIYSAALERAGRIYATEVQTVVDGADTFFPSLDASWKAIEHQDHNADTDNKYPYKFVTYERQHDSHINIANTRLEEQRGVYEQIASNKECPFCAGNYEKYNSHEILRRGKQWFIAPNQWPYENTDLHIMAIPTYHAENLNELREGAFDELLEHVQWLEREYNVQTGALAMRFGDTKLNGGSVNHLHMHFIVPSGNKPADAAVKFKIS